MVFREGVEAMKSIAIAPAKPSALSFLPHRHGARRYAVLCWEGAMKQIHWLFQIVVVGMIATTAMGGSVGRAQQPAKQIGPAVPQWTLMKADRVM
jgi:hypothetical protein